MFRSSPSNALSKTRKRTTQEKKRHTINAQVVICLLTLTILSVVAGKGRQHDFSVFKDSCLLLHPDALLLAVSGYQGIHKLHQNSALPIKKKKGQPLSAEDKAHNKALSKQRIFIEHINRRCKIFRIVKDVIGASTRITR
jgi:hypothetical protein